MLIFILTLKDLFLIFHEVLVTTCFAFINSLPEYSRFEFKKNFCQFSKIFTFFWLILSVDDLMASRAQILIISELSPP